MSLKELGLRAPKFVHFLRLNNEHNWDGHVWSFYEKCNLHDDDIQKSFIRALNIMKKNGYIHDVNLLIILQLLAYSISYKKWVQS